MASTHKDFSTSERNYRFATNPRIQRRGEGGHSKAASYKILSFHTFRHEQIQIIPITCSPKHSHRRQTALTKYISRLERTPLVCVFSDTPQYNTHTHTHFETKSFFIVMILCPSNIETPKTILCEMYAERHQIPVKI